MPEENENLEENVSDREESAISEAQAKKERNVAANANVANAALDAASKKPGWIGAAATAAKGINKLTGGKLTRSAGKVMNLSNKITPGGRITQALTNKMSESGTVNRINSAVNKKNQQQKSQASSSFFNKTATHKQKDNSFFSKKETEEETSDGGGESFNITAAFMKVALVASVPIFVVVIFCNLFISASQLIAHSIGLGNADNMFNDEIEKKINADGLEDTDRSDEDLEAFEYSLHDSTNVTIFRNSKLKKAKNEYEIKSGKYNEAEVSELDDYYSHMVDFDSDVEDMDIVYTFFFKLHYLYKYYAMEYNVSLDLPLLMSTLSVDINDKSTLFESNIIGYGLDEVKLKEKNDRFSYDKVHNYISTKKRAEYDMEVLAQNMVSRVPYVAEEKTCEEKDVVDGMCYYIDYDKYYEFLKEFLEKKYFLNNVAINSGENSNSGSATTNSDYRNWTQCGKSWSDELLPGSKKNMCQIGCLVTSVAMQIERSGTITVEENIDPGVALEYFDFTKGQFIWKSTTNLAPNFVYKNYMVLSGLSKEKIAKKLLSYDSNKYYMVLAVSKLDRNSVHHYVALDYVDSSTNEIYIMDPLNISNKKLYDNYKIYRAYLYEKRD